MGLCCHSGCDEGTREQVEQVEQREERERSLHAQNTSSTQPDDTIITLSFEAEPFREGPSLKISLADLNAAWRVAHPDRPLTSADHAERAALINALIELKTLARRARELGYDQSDDAIAARDRALAQRLVVEFEATHNSATLSSQHVARARQRNLGLFRHPELRRALHILVKPKREDVLKVPVSDQEADEMRDVVARIARDLDQHPVHHELEFIKRAERYKPWAPEGYEVIMERLGRFALEGRFHKGFTRPAFAVQTPNTLTGPHRTPFGVHLIWVADVIPPLDTPEAEIEAQVRSRLTPEVRRHEWGLLIGKLIKDTPILGYR